MPTEIAVEIRPAEPGDQPALDSLWEEVGLAVPTPDEWDALMSGATNAVLVAPIAGQLAGSAIAAFDGWRAYIYHVAVAADMQQRGLGHRMLREAEQYLLGAGARYVYVMVHEESTEGMALVASAGYLPEGEIVLAKRLASRVA